MSYSPASEKETRVEAASLPSPLPLSPSLSRGFLKFVALAGPDLLLLTVMTLFLTLTVWVHGGTIRWAQNSVLAPIYMMGFLLLSRTAYWSYGHFRQKSQALSLKTIFLHTLRDWIPFIVIDFIYENLHDFSQLFYTHDHAGTIMALDIKLFGVELTQWSQRFFHPLLTDYMAFAYALYFILPLILMYFLSYRNRRSQLKQVILALSMAFLMGFLGYAFVPCSPPRYFLEHAYTHPPHLYGYFLYNQLQARWDSLSVVSAGAFPSLHVGISTVALIFAYRFRKQGRLDRILFWMILPLAVSLWASTVYLRHHWFMDILAGWTLASLSCWIAPVLTKSWEGLRSRLDLTREVAPHLG